MVEWTTEHVTDNDDDDDNNNNNNNKRRNNGRVDLIATGQLAQRHDAAHSQTDNQLPTVRCDLQGPSVCSSFAVHTS